MAISLFFFGEIVVSTDYTKRGAIGGLLWLRDGEMLDLVCSCASVELD